MQQGGPRRVLVLHPKDNVAVALDDLRKGELVEVEVGGSRATLRVLEYVPFGHKLALREIRNGDPVIMYGEVIGVATRDIPAGAHVHVHNVSSTKRRWGAGWPATASSASRGRGAKPA